MHLNKTLSYFISVYFLENIVSKLFDQIVCFRFNEYNEKKEHFLEKLRSENTDIILNLISFRNINKKF